MGIPQATFQNIPNERVAELTERLKEVKWKGNVEVYLNHSPLFRQIFRLFQRGRRTNFFVRVLRGIPSAFEAYIFGKLGRVSAYNPWAETVQAYQPQLGVVEHEIGHAEQFDETEHPTIMGLAYHLPFMKSVIEWQASRNAMKHMEKEERRKAAKILEPALGSYIGGDLWTLGAANPVTAPIAPFIPLVGIVAGHIHSRLPGSRNIFYNGEEVAAVQNPQGQLAPAYA